MKSFNWSNLNSNSIQQIKQEAEQLGIDLPSGKKKSELLDILLTARSKSQGSKSSISAQNSPRTKNYNIKQIAMTPQINPSNPAQSSRNVPKLDGIEGQAPVARPPSPVSGQIPVARPPSPQDGREMSPLIGSRRKAHSSSSSAAGSKESSSENSSSASSRALTPSSLAAKRQSGVAGSLRRVLPFIISALFVVSCVQPAYAGLFVLCLIIYILLQYAY